MRKEIFERKFFAAKNLLKEFKKEKRMKIGNDSLFQYMKNKERK